MAKEAKNYRLGIDLGATSLGWCMLELNSEKEPIGIINMGVRIFPDGRDLISQEPLAVKRRGYRGARRNLDRYLERLHALIRYLMDNGFLPRDEQERKEVFQINPYYLRAKALDEALNPAEFSRALIHLAKRRGFRSNRKVLSDKTTKLSEAIANLKEQLSQAKARTLGEYLWHLYQETPEDQGHLRKPIKFRYKDDPEYPNPIFPTREMVEHEFESIWDSQARYNQLLTESHKEQIRKIIFHQRPLMPTEKGKCELEPDEYRAPLAHPVFQEFRLLQSLNHMKIVDVFSNESYPLTAEQYHKLYNFLNQRDKATFAALRKEILGKQSRDYRINLEISEERDLPGNQTNAAVLNTQNDALIKYWQSCDSDLNNKIIDIVISDLDDEPATLELLALGVPQNLTDELLNLHLKAGYCKLSLKAMQNILPHLRKGQVYSEACSSAGYNHSLEYNGEVYAEGDLPYYGEVLRRETIALNRKTGDAQADEHGKINNPTVHVALNQLRKLVNALSLRYGAPSEIVLELGKDAPLSKEKRDELKKGINQNTALNNKIKDFLDEHQIPWNHTNMLRVKLWWELGDDPLDRRCVYSGNQISVTDLFSRNVEIDHILPFSRTYEDRNANKLLCFHAANQYKGERTPYEAFHDSRDGYDWQGILTRTKNLSESKQRRFLSDAMKRFEEEGDLIGRMLNDTRYMSRVAMKYMWYVCGNSKVWAVTGKHTSLLRSKWGLNAALGETDAKERTDHRHHAIDAFVIALTTRSLVKQVAELMANTSYRQISNLPPPWQSFNHEDFRARVHSIMVSYKPDQINPAKLIQRRQTGGALAEDTAYNCIGQDPENPKYMLYTVRKTITDLTPRNIKNVVRDDLRRELEQIALGREGKDFTSSAVAWARRNNIKKIKLTYSMNPDSMIPVKDKSGRVFKYYSSGENLFADIYINDPRNNPDCQWKMEIVNSYKAHQQGFVPQWKIDDPKAKRIMRLYKDDVIAIDGPNGRELRRFRKMTYGVLYFRELNIAKKPKGKDDVGEQFSANQLMLKRARKAGVDIMGRYFDPITNEQHP